MSQQSARLSNRRFPQISCFLTFLLSWFAAHLGVCQSTAWAQSELIKLAESYTSNQFYQAQSRIVTSGEVITARKQEEKDRLKMQATANFRFIDRLLPPSGRDAFALRAIRHFSQAELETAVGSFKTTSSLDDGVGLIVASGRREGVLIYAPDKNLDSDSLGLLELPGDPLAVIALLPLEAKEIGQDWAPAEWAIQMLAGIDAAEKLEMNCTLEAANDLSVKITFTGSAKGHHLGAPADVNMTGTIIFDRRTNHISRAQVKYQITSEVGTIDPGTNLNVTADFARTVLEEQDKITPEIIEAIPFDPPEKQLELAFRVPQWGIEVNHPRDWHLINTVVDSSNPIAILRLNEFGSLVAQCNIKPLLNSPAGKSLPLEQFEADIQDALGERFIEFGKREEVPVDDGRRIFRVEAIGQTRFQGSEDKAIEIPMLWVYYLVSNPEGRQASLVFSLERPLAEQLGERDIELVKSLRFSAPVKATQRPVETPPQ